MSDAKPLRRKKRVKNKQLSKMKGRNENAITAVKIKLNEDVAGNFGHSFLQKSPRELSVRICKSCRSIFSR